MNGGRRVFKYYEHESVNGSGFCARRIFTLTKSEQTIRDSDSVLRVDRIRVWGSATWPTGTKRDSRHKILVLYFQTPALILKSFAEVGDCSRLLTR